MLKTFFSIVIELIRSPVTLIRLLFDSRVWKRTYRALIERDVASFEKAYENLTNIKGYRKRLTQKGRLLESKYPGITVPMGLYTAKALQEKFFDIDFEVSPLEKRRINILLPQLEPLIMFGGYLSCLQFMRRLYESGYSLRIIVCESNSYDKNGVLEKYSAHSSLVKALRETEVVCAKDKFVISNNDEFVAYSVWTAYYAHQLSSRLDKRFIFFIQEYEPIFYSYNSLHALAKKAYDLPHVAIFNTEILQSYFEANELGVFRAGGLSPESLYLNFQHALVNVKPASEQEMGAKPKRKLLLYARPEAHAERNLFEVAVLALKTAVKNGTFEPDLWEFYGVGTLGTEVNLDIGKNCTLKILSSLPLSDYAESLKSFDVGVSLMFAPHPSIIPFEMASAGVVTITNIYENRDADLLRSISRNIVPCDISIESVVEALGVAAEESLNFTARRENAQLSWVRSWDEAFDDKFMSRLNWVMEGGMK